MREGSREGGVSPLVVRATCKLTARILTLVEGQTDPSPRGYVLEKSVAFIGVTMGWTSAEVLVQQSLFMWG